MYQGYRDMDYQQPFEIKQRQNELIVITTHKTLGRTSILLYTSMILLLHPVESRQGSGSFI